MCCPVGGRHCPRCRRCHLPASGLRCRCIRCPVWVCGALRLPRRRGAWAIILGAHVSPPLPALGVALSLRTQLVPRENHCVRCCHNTASYRRAWAAS